MYLSILILPLLGSIVSGFLGRKVGVTGSHIITISCLSLSSLLATIAFFEVGICGSPVSIDLISWIDSENISITWSFLFDSLTVSMFIPVLYISTLIHLFSVNYMGEDPHQQRFFSYLSLFTFFMLLLVSGANYFVLFAGWEGKLKCLKWLSTQIYKLNIFKYSFSNKSMLLKLFLSQLLVITTPSSERNAFVHSVLKITSSPSLFLSASCRKLHRNKNTQFLSSKIEGLLLLINRIYFNSPIYIRLVIVTLMLISLLTLGVAQRSVYLTRTNYTPIQFDSSQTKVTSSKRIGPHNIDIISLIIGSTLGDSHLEKRTNGVGTRIVFEQSNKNVEYLMWFHKFLSSRGYCNPQSPKLHKRIRKNGEIFFHYRIKSYTFSSLNWLHDMFYKETIIYDQIEPEFNNHKLSCKYVKIIPTNLEDYLTPLALAIWFSDDGSKAGTGAKISTNCFTHEEVALLCDILHNKYKLYTRINSGGTNKGEVIRISTKSMSNFSKIVKPLMVPSLHYKLGNT